MTTDELIRALREMHARFQENQGVDSDKLEAVMEEAADRLEELDERVAIMMEGKE